MIMKSSDNKMKGFGHKSKGNNKENFEGLNNEFNQEKKALEFIKAGKLLEAEKIYQKLIEIGTRNHNIYGNLAALYGMKGNKSEMYKLLKKAIEIEPNYSEAHNNLGTLFSDQKNYDQAIKYYNSLIKLFPNNHL